MRLVKIGQKGILLALFYSMAFCAFVQAATTVVIPGDVDGNGVVNTEDAELVARHVKDQRIRLPHPENADANEDGKITIEDASAISQRVEGTSRVVVATAEYGLHGRTCVGSLIRIEVFERFFPLHIIGGTVRIKSPSTEYDLGEQRLVFERHGRSLYYHWNTGGLRPASDYQVYVRLTESAAPRGVPGAPSWPSPDKLVRPDIVAKLIPRAFEVTQLARAQDAFAPCPGISLAFRRVSPHDSVYAPRLGPMGFGWMHNFDIHLTEFTNGRIAFVGSSGFNRWFESNHDGTYTASPGDYGVLSRDPDGAFQLKEKDGLIYRFRSDLRLDCIQDTNNNRVSAIYDASNQLIKLHHSCGKSFSLVYNAAARIVALTDHVGRITKYEYDSSSQMLTKVVDPDGAVTEYTYILGQSDVLDHRLIAIAFPDGTYKHYEYDSQARLIRKTGTWGANPVSYSYDDDGTTHITNAVGGTVNVSVNEQKQPVLMTDPDGGRTEMQYDTSANLTALTDPLGHRTKLTYDKFGNATEVIDPLGQIVRYDYDLRFHKPTKIKNPLGNSISFEYDSRGNLQTTTFPDDSSESYEYDAQGNLVAIQDAARKTNWYFYNEQGLMTSSKDALDHVTQFSYDAAGDLERLVDAKGHTISHKRDKLGRLRRRTYPDGSHEDYEYDAAGKVIKFTNRQGQKISFSYGATGRLEYKLYPSGKKLRFHYDPRGLVAKVEVVSGEKTALNAAYEHDLSGRLVRAKVPGKTAQQSYDVSYAYDAADNRTFMAHPDGYALKYEYDTADRLTRVSEASCKRQGLLHNLR